MTSWLLEGQFIWKTEEERVQRIEAERVQGGQVKLCENFLKRWIGERKDEKRQDNTISNECLLVKV